MKLSLECAILNTSKEPKGANNMKTYGLDDFIKEVRHCVDTHKLENDGEYRRWLWGEGRELGINEYGVADAANILYTINDFPQNREEREGFVKTLQNMQNPENGMFRERTHHTIHTTAHCTAALELFDAKPLYDCKMLERLKDKDTLYSFLDNELDWNKPWGESHKGAGLFVSMTNADMVDLDWKNAYFDWMWENSDPETGYIVHGKKTAPLHEYMAGGFHYMFNHESERRPYRYPEKLIDTSIYLMENRMGGMIKKCGFIEIDIVYCLSRAMRQSPHRFYEAKKALEDFAEEFIEFLYSLDYEKDEWFNDLHMLFGAMCAVAEMQLALPGEIISTVPMKNVLDRRPFI